MVNHDPIQELNNDNLQNSGMDPIMSLTKRGKELEAQGRTIKYLNMGWPTFPVYTPIAEFLEDYWRKQKERSEKAYKLLIDGANLDDEAYDTVIDEVIQLEAALPYDHPQGNLEARKDMAASLSQMYSPKRSKESRESRESKKQEGLISEKNVLYTTGGSTGLHISFLARNKKHPNGIIVVPAPHYTLYSGPNHGNNLFEFDLMDKPGMRMTPEILKEAIYKAHEKAKQEKTIVSVVMICDPDNPRGQRLGKTVEEVKRYTEILIKYAAINKDVIYMLDEPYNGMTREGQHVSLLMVAPELKNRIFLFNSGTKYLSAAAERMATTVADERNIDSLVNESCNINGLSPVSLQKAYASAMRRFIHDKQTPKLSNRFYGRQIDIVSEGLKALGLWIDPKYDIEAGFYVMANFNELIDKPLYYIMAEYDKVEGRSLDEIKDHFRALKDYPTPEHKISTDVDICFYFLEKKDTLFSMLSAFVKNRELKEKYSKKGVVRWTCSQGIKTNKEALADIETVIKAVRIWDLMILKNHCDTTLDILGKGDHYFNEAITLTKKVNRILGSQPPEEISLAMHLKDQIVALQQQLTQAEKFLRAEQRQTSNSNQVADTPKKKHRDSTLSLLSMFAKKDTTSDQVTGENLGEEFYKGYNPDNDVDQAQSGVRLCCWPF